MACCKICCGCTTCTEGQIGKCCCGETCCQSNEYCCGEACCTGSEFCCAGVCYAEPCCDSNDDCSPETVCYYGTCIPGVRVCCIPATVPSDPAVRSEAYETQSACEAAGGVWRLVSPYDANGCEGCYVPTVSFGGWFVAENVTAIQELADAGGWNVTFIYPDYPNGYCPEEEPGPTGIRMCPGPFTDECGQTWTSAVFTAPRVTCDGYCGTVSAEQLGYGCGGNLWPSVFGFPEQCSGFESCEDLILEVIPDGDYIIPKLCEPNAFP